MAIYKTSYGLSADQEDNPYLIAEDWLEKQRNKTFKYYDPNAPLVATNPDFDEYSTLPPGIPHTPEGLEQYRAMMRAAGERKHNRFANREGGVFNTGTSDPIADPDTDKEKPDVHQDEPITEQPIPSAPTPGTGADEYMKQLQDLFQSGSVSDQYKAAIMAAIKAQELTTQQAVEQIEYQKKLAEKARTKSNREADLTFSRAINPTGKLNQNIRSAGLAGSGWQETSQVGLTNAYQNALNTNTSDYNTAVKELNMAISQAKLTGDIATMQAIQTYAIQLAQQLYQESRDAVADRQWEKSYALQKAAFDLEHAAQMESSGYYQSTTPNYPNWPAEEPEEEEVDPEESSETASDVDEKIKGLWWKGFRGEEFKRQVSLLISQYTRYLNDKDLEALANSCGMTVEEISKYI